MTGTFNTAGKAGWIILAVIVILVVIIGGVVVGGYNRAVRLDEAVQSSWSQVENQLQRRFDLIPNLVETVKGYASHEQEIFENLAQARTQYFQANSVNDKAQAAGLLQGALSRLLLLQERYPDLKANQSFLKLQDQLEGTENRIAVERMRYNEAVRNLNTFARSFMGRFYTSLAGVEKAEYFEAPEAAQTAPQVQF